MVGPMHTPQVAAFDRVVGFIDLKLANVTVRVPVRSAEETAMDSSLLATVEEEGRVMSIVVRGPMSSKPVQTALRKAAKEVAGILSRRVLN